MRLQKITAATAWTLALAAVLLSGCGGGGDATPAASIDATADSGAAESPAPTNASDTDPQGAAAQVTTTPPPPTTSRYSGTPAASTGVAQGNRYPSFVQAKAIQVVMQTNKGEIKLRLFPDKAPQTVNNFLRNYVETSFYDGSIIHFADDSMVVAGGFRQNFSAIPATLPIRCEANNGLKNVRGTVAMGRVPEEIDSATSHFFFNIQDNRDFDHAGETPADFGYCVFGEVVEGMAIVDQISKAPTQDKDGFSSVPVSPVVIEKLKVIRE